MKAHSSYHQEARSLTDPTMLGFLADDPAGNGDELPMRPPAHVRAEQWIDINDVPDSEFHRLEPQWNSLRWSESLGPDGKDVDEVELAPDEAEASTVAA